LSKTLVPSFCRTIYQAGHRARGAAFPFARASALRDSPAQPAMRSLDARKVPATAAPVLTLLVFVAGFATPLVAAPLPDDRAITLHSARDAKERRRSLIHFLWGSDSLPLKRQPDAVRTIASPVSHLTNLARVDELRIDLAPGLDGLAYHFVPERAN